jgi:dihydroorotate dehydrogenase electron transfer subunit
VKPKQRNTICVENAEVLTHLEHPADQFVLRMRAPGCAARAVPGSFIHIRCDADIPMRRPLSIMRADAKEGWIEVLYKTVGSGLSALSKTAPGDELSIIGPIGKGFDPDPARPLAILIGGGVGIPPLLFQAERMSGVVGESRPVAFFGSEIPFPFELRESALALDVETDGVPMTIGLLEDWNIPSRLASAAGIAGCYRGFVTDLARQWMNALDKNDLARATIYSCGPEPMLQAAARLAREFSVPSQLCLEEFMACGVGGCAGCTVLVQTEKGPAMRRVCVDGPVFPGEAVYPVSS